MTIVEVEVIHVTEPRAVATGLLLATDILNKGPVATARGSVTIYLPTFDWPQA